MEQNSSAEEIEPDIVAATTTRPSGDDSIIVVSANDPTSCYVVLGLRLTLPKSQGAELCSLSQKGKALMLAKILEEINDDRPGVSAHFSAGTLVDE